MRNEDTRGTHWTFGLVDCRSRVIEYWDSCQGIGDADIFFKVWHSSFYLCMSSNRNGRRSWSICTVDTRRRKGATKILFFALPTNGYLSGEMYVPDKPFGSSYALDLTHRILGAAANEWLGLRGLRTEQYAEYRSTHRLFPTTTHRKHENAPCSPSPP